MPNATIRIAALLLIFAMAGTCGPAGFAQETRSDERAITDLEDEFATAWAKRDLKFIERYFSHDADLAWFFERRQITGFEGVRGLYERMFSASVNVKRTLSHRRIRVYGDAAFSTANFRVESREAGRRVVDEGRISTFYARANNRWVAVHRHTSFQAPPALERRASPPRPPSKPATRKTTAAISLQSEIRSRF